MVFTKLKEAFNSGQLSPAFASFNMGSIIEYFVEARGDYRSIRESSFQMFADGHVQDIEIQDDRLSKKTLVKSKCLAQMNPQKYCILTIISHDGQIEQANCGCAAGRGPKATCKHIASHCYALDDFIRAFVLNETQESRTELLQRWNVPRNQALTPLPTYEINFEKKKFGREPKGLSGAHPSTYDLNQVCKSDEAAVATFLSELKTYQDTEGRTVGLLNVVDRRNPLTTSESPAPSAVQSHVQHVEKKIGELKKQTDRPMDLKVQDMMSSLKVTNEERESISQETQEQSSSRTWKSIREKRITASACHRVATYTGRTDGAKVASAIIKPAAFSTASTVFGIENEPMAIGKYRVVKQTDDKDIEILKTGFVIDQERGYLGCSPDGIIKNSDGSCGLLEVKCPPKFSQTTPAAAVAQKAGYPVRMVSTPDGEKMQLNRANAYYHQVQLALYCCRDKVTYADFFVYHVSTDTYYLERIVPDKVWVDKNISKFAQFYQDKVAPVLLA